MFTFFVFQYLNGSEMYTTLIEYILEHCAYTCCSRVEKHIKYISVNK